MENENIIPEEEEVSILTLTDENGQDTDFEYLDCIEYQGKEYLVLMPADEMATEIVIRRSPLIFLTPRRSEHPYTFP